MRKLTLLACLLFFVSRADAAITLVQHRSVTVSFTSISASLAFSSNTTAGNLIIASCGEFDNRGTNVPVLKDGVGIHSGAITDIGDASTFHHAVSVYSNIAGGASTITCTSELASFFTIIIAEYSGLDPRYPVDVFNQAYSASGSSKSAGAITTVQADEVICAFYYDDHIPGGVNYTATIGSGFTIQEQSGTFGSNTQGGFADLIVSSLQTGLNPSWSNGTWALDGVTLIIVGLQQSFSTVPNVRLAQAAQVGTTAGAVNYPLAFGSGNTAGNFIVAGCVVNLISFPATLSFTDSNSNTYTTIDTLNNGVNQTVLWAYAKNIAGGANTVTCHSTISGDGSVLLGEYRGLTTGSALDQHTALLTAVPSGRTLATAITTTSSKEIVVLFQVRFYSGNAPTAIDNIGSSNYKTETAFTSSINLQPYLTDLYVTTTGTYQPYSVSYAASPVYQFLASFIQAPATTGTKKIRSQVIRYKRKKVNHAQILTASL